MDYMLSIFVCLCCFLFFSRKITYIYEVKVNKFWSHYILDPLDQASLMFLRYLIKVSEGEILRQYFKHICLLLLFVVFLGKCH